MTYLQFHLVFILPPLLLLAVLTRGVSARLGPRARWTLPVMALIALCYTTPWDNYLVWRGIWWYGPERVMATIGYVPVEEYAFFVLQPLLTGLFTYWLLMRGRGRGSGSGSGSGSGMAVPALYALAALAGFAALFNTRTLYAGLILAWAAPVLLAQWLVAGAALRARGVAFVTAIAIPTLYLWVADRVAIGAGIWSISPRYTTGLHLLGLPVEEALFFLVTNVLVVQGVFLFLFPEELRLPGRASPEREHTRMAA